MYQGRTSFLFGLCVLERRRKKKEIVRRERKKTKKFN